MAKIRYKKRDDANGHFYATPDKWDTAVPKENIGKVLLNWRNNETPLIGPNILSTAILVQVEKKTSKSAKLYSLGSRKRFYACFSTKFPLSLSSPSKVEEKMCFCFYWELVLVWKAEYRYGFIFALGLVINTVGTSHSTISLSRWSGTRPRWKRAADDLAPGLLCHLQIKPHKRGLMALRTRGQNAKVFAFFERLCGKRHFLHFPAFYDSTTHTLFFFFLPLSIFFFSIPSRLFPVFKRPRERQGQRGWEIRTFILVLDFICCDVGTLFLILRF